MKTPHVLAAVAALLLCSCTKTTETAIVSAVEAACVPVLSAEVPDAPAICVVADELIQAAGDYIESHAGATPPTAHAEGATRVPGDMYRSLAARPTVRGRTVKKCPACPVCAPPTSSSGLPGRVAP